MLGFDQQQKPSGARFSAISPELVAKAAELMGLKVYKPNSPNVADVAKKLPIGRLYANGRALRAERAANALQRSHCRAWQPNPAGRGWPRGRQGQHPGRPRPAGSWDEIAPGHLVIAQESLAYGWWEAIVIDRKDDMLTLRFRDYPRLPKFFRHRTAVALMSPASGQ